MRSILGALAVLACSGCLSHRASVDGSGADLAAGRSAVAREVGDGAPSATVVGPLPHEIPATWMLKGADGRLIIGHAVALSPLPWWQRFPFDFAVDLWPGDVLIAANATVEPRPVTPRSAADITAEARAHGYAE